MGLAKLFFRFFDLLSRSAINPYHLKEITKVANQQCDYYYLPNNSKRLPIIINLHGGGFVAGDKKYRRYWCEILAKEGWFVINANYRLCPEVTIIEQIKDVWQIMENLPQLAERFPIDSDQVVVTGDSAGAFLAGYLLALQTNPTLRTRLGLSKTNQARIIGAMLFCGIYDFNALLNDPKRWHSGLVKDIAQSITGVKYRQLNATDYQYADVLTLIPYINAAWCPVQVFYAKRDYFVKGQGELLFQALQEHQIPAEQHYTKNLWDNHCYHLYFRTKISKKTVKLVKQFLSNLTTTAPVI